MGKSKRVTQPKRVLWPTPSSFTWNGGEPSLTEGMGRRFREGKGHNLMEAVAAEIYHPNPSAEDGTSPQLTLFAEVSPVSPSAKPDEGKEPQTNAGSGLSSRESFAFFDPDSSSWKTCQVSLLSTEELPLERYSGTWPPSGTMRNGKAFLRPPLVPRTSATESSLWQTPSVEDAGRTGSAEAWREWLEAGHTTQARLRNQIHWPTPRSFMHKDIQTDRGKSNLGEVVGGQLNPMWVEWLMGFPLGWTALEPSEMPLSPKSRSGSVKGSSKR